MKEVRIRARLSDLREQAELKPRGFLQACREAAKEDAGGILLFEPEDYVRLFERYEDYAPTAGQRMGHFFRAMGRWAADWFQRVDRPTRERRRRTCEACEFWRRDPAFGFMACSQCGCSRLKWEVRGERCPVGKW